MGFITNLLGGGKSGAGDGGKTEINLPSAPTQISPWDRMQRMTNGRGANGMAQDAVFQSGPAGSGGPPSAGEAALKPQAAPAPVNPQQAAWDRYMQQNQATGDAGPNPNDAALFKMIWD